MARTGELIAALTGEGVMRADVLSRIDELRALLPTFDDNALYPRRLHVQLLNAIVESSHDPAKAAERLQRCGRSIATRDGDPFWDAARRILTPPLLLKSLPRLWALDQQGGESFAIEDMKPDVGHATAVLSGLDDYSHIAIVAAGWLESLLGSVPAGNVQVTQQDWSMGTPAPAQVRFEVRWAANAMPAESAEEAEIRDLASQALLTLAHAHGDNYATAPTLLLRGPSSMKVVFAWLNEILIALATEQEQGAAFRKQLEEKLVTVEQQRAAIRELSTPIIEVWNGVLCLPVVGVIDTTRSVDMTSSLLQAVIEKDARYAIVDITGIEVMDTRTVDHFIQMAKAVRLLGARYALAGVSPQIAQTVVRMGLDLGELTTYRNLREALQSGINEQRGEPK
jgi:rsbT co-antagonist protein RsbR